ncbi:hypothetical protein BV372_03130, partial [Nostoc sp. T09]|uniref:hypothetical protein n=1 Tax=Nostoc sp. T09 TaxID=1932621 RepID=UPI000B6522D1
MYTKNKIQLQINTDKIVLNLEENLCIKKKKEGDFASFFFINCIVVFIDLSKKFLTESAFVVSTLIDDTPWEHPTLEETSGEWNSRLHKP